MNTIAPRPYVVKDGQGYKAEEGSEEKTQDSLQQGNRGNQGDRQQQQGNRQQPRTIASGRASESAAAKKSFPKRPLAARRGKPIRMGGNSNGAQPRPAVNQSAPQAAPRMPQQMPPQRMAGMTPQRQPMQRPMGQPQMMPQRQPMQQQAPQQLHQAPQQMQPAPRQMQQPQQQQQAPEQNNPQAQQQINNMARNNKVNIAQVIKDFRGTYVAIGTPKCLVDEVESYLQDVEQHTKGEAPSINYVQTNLQNAAVILDKYISETLEKESKVVQNWLDALFLQRINYRYNDGEINQDFLVKFPEGNTPQQPDSVVDNAVVHEKPQAELQEIPDYEPIPQQAEPAHHTVPIQHANVQRPPQARPVSQIRSSRPIPPRPAQRPVPQRPAAPVRRKPQITIIPEDNELKALFVQAKKQAYSKNPAKAMNIFQKALQRAVAINDGESQSKICYEMGKIYDDNNYLAQALNSYNKSLNVTTDTNIKTRAHYSMAKIYDDVNQIDSAINHYMTSVSYAGVEDDLSSQSKSLTNIANIYTDKYNQDAFVFYDEANVLVNQTDDSETKGYVSSNTAGAYNKFNKPDKALKCYASAVKNYSDAKVSNSVAENYRAAGELMYDLRNPAKAKILLRKALAHTDKYKDSELINRINDLLEEIG